jgi:hypothetical protein
MTVRSKAAIAALAAGASLAGVTVAAAPAQASPAVGPASVDCFEVSVREGGWTDVLTLTNLCGSTESVKVVLHNAFDSCQTVGGYGTKRFNMHVPASFDRLAEC